MGGLFCSECQANLRPTAPQRDAHSPLTERRSTAEYSQSIRRAIHALKYQYRTQMAEPLGLRLAAQLAQSGWTPTLITAVPLHEKRLTERGYNQAALLAGVLAREAKIPARFDLVTRVRETRPQVGLNYGDRQQNVKDAFQVAPEMFQAPQALTQARIVIVDDVYTTGATLRACASALCAAGAGVVWGLTVASAVHLDDDRST